VFNASPGADDARRRLEEIYGMDARLVDAAGYRCRYSEKK